MDVKVFMNRFLIVFLLILSCVLVKSQIEFINTPYDIGVVTAAGSDYLDIPIKNISKEKVFIFRTEASKQFEIHYSSKTILPDSTIFMRVLFTPTQKGIIHEKLPIHFSCFDKPIVVEFTGYTENLPTNSSTSCPNFEQQGVNTVVTFDFTVKVVDAETNQLLPESEVKMIKNGMVAELLDTKKKGFAERPLEIGYYYFIASNEAYISNELGAYVNRKNNIITIPLVKKKVEEVFVENVEILDPILPEEIEENEVVTIEETGPEVKEIVEETEELYPEFSLKDYRPNNIVFLVDVSSSMNQSGKLDLLKASMIEMTKMLRPVDKITVVSYATRANLILETTPGSDIDSVIKVIQGLTAKGVTAGGKGMELAYSKACNAFISNGNNQIIMATDGLFNSGDENVYKMAKMYSKKGVKVSVIGIKNQSSHVQYMEDLAKDGKGNYVNIESYEQAQQTLVNEIKNQSKLHP